MMLLDADGEMVVDYTVDAWGRVYAIDGSMADTLGILNPLIYRGYVYDHETGLYYLNSRYYDPKVGRFINADVLISTGQGLLGNNMFAYCRNNPVMRVDAAGTFDKKALGTDGDPLRNEKDPTGRASTGTKFVPNQYGKLGSPAHRATVDGIKNDLVTKGFSEIKTETRIEISSGYKPYRYADITATKGGMNYAFQVGKATTRGIPVARERRALADIFSTGNYMVFFIEY